MRIYLILPILSLFLCCSKPVKDEPDNEIPMEEPGEEPVEETVDYSFLQDSTFRHIVKTYFPDGNVFMGGTSHYRLFGTQTIDILDSEFSYVTPANDFKQTAIHQTPTHWNWEKPDAWIAHCAESGQIIRMHAPISPQCSKWAKDDSRTPEELEQNMTEYMTELCKRYNGVSLIKWLDVVNETVSRDGTWFGPREGTDKWENPWPIIGYDSIHPLKVPTYILKAFQIANEHAPNIKQIINQHGGMEDVMWDKVKQTVLYLREKGVRIDGIGWQAHIDVGFEKVDGNMQRLSDLIDWAHANKLEFHVTENTVWLKNDKAGKWDEQADTFGAIVEMVLSKKESGVVSWNIWNLLDTENSNPQWTGSLFFENYQPKPAFATVKEKLIEAIPVQ